MHYFLYDEILTEARSWNIKAYEDFIKQCSVFFRTYRLACQS